MTFCLEDGRNFSVEGQGKNGDIGCSSMSNAVGEVRRVVFYHQQPHGRAIKARQPGFLEDLN